MFQLLVGAKVPFISYRRYAYIFSSLILLAGLVSFIAHGGFRLGVDFAGGILVEYRFSHKLEADQLRAALSRGGYPEAEIQASEGGEVFLIRVPSPEERIAGEAPPSDKILAAVQSEIPDIEGELLREEVVGPRVGKELGRKAFWAILFALLGILIYVGIRYEFKFAFGGIVALLHDVLVILAFFSLMNKEITIPVIAALLTIGGFSINDTIVIFDRVRERLKGSGRPADEEIFNLAINQTLSRTLITTLTVLFTTEALYFLGGPVIHDFSLAVLLGVIFGSYSTIFIASALALDLTLAAERRRKAAEAQAARIKA